MRRLFWLGVGAVAGATGTVWAERKVRARLDALQPDHLVVAAGHRARAVGRNVVDAVAEGRGVMRAREVELRRSYDSGRAGTPLADERVDRARRSPSTGPTRPRSGTWPNTTARHRH